MNHSIMEPNFTIVYLTDFPFSVEPKTDDGVHQEHGTNHIPRRKPLNRKRASKMVVVDRNGYLHRILFGHA